MAVEVCPCCSSLARTGFGENICDLILCFCLPFLASSFLMNRRIILVCFPFLKKNEKGMEPNEHHDIDLPSVIWLQDYLSTFLSTLLVVAHDREFIDDIASSSSSPNGGETIVLRNKSLSYFPGNFTSYERVSRKKRRGDIRAKEAMDRKKEAVEKSIEAGMRSAKKSGDDNRAKMVKSRQKKLDERWGLEKSAKGGRYVLFHIPRFNVWARLMPWIAIN